jgi:hypothetical protein
MGAADARLDKLRHVTSELLRATSSTGLVILVNWTPMTSQDWFGSGRDADRWIRETHVWRSVDVQSENELNLPHEEHAADIKPTIASREAPTVE